VKFGNIDTTLHIPFIDKTVPLGIVYYVFAVILIVGVVNSVNLTDGLDGLASSITLVVGLFFAAVLFTVKSPMLIENEGARASLSFVSSALIGSMIGFLIYNHHPAKVFMGDTGSLFLGGMVVGTAFIIDEPLIIVIAGGIYFFELISVVIQRGVFKITRLATGRGRRVFKCAPAHHHFEKCGWSEGTVVTVFTLITVILCGIAWIGLYF
jgi:phospho-N-acetylmuramoyl-pentapeptide-transferase